MATQNIIQYLETSQYNALPSGGTVAVGIEAMNRRQIETFIASEAIATAADMARRGGEAMVQQAEMSRQSTLLGVEFGGMAEAKVKAGTGVGESLSIFNTTAGVLEPYQNTFEDPILAIAGAAEAGGTAIVFVIKQF